MSYGSGSFSQSGYSDTGSAAGSVNLIASLGVITQYGVMVAPILREFSGISSTAYGVIDGSAAFTPRPVVGKIIGDVGTQYGTMLGSTTHVIFDAPVLFKAGVMVGESGKIGGAFAGIAVTTYGTFIGGLTGLREFDGVGSTAYGVISALTPVTGVFAGPRLFSSGFISGPSRTPVDGYLVTARYKENRMTITGAPF